MTDQKLCELALWLTYKSVEDEEGYWKAHVKAQEEIRKRLLAEKYYDEFFYPYVFLKDTRWGNEEWSSNDVEREFSNDYEALLEELKENEE